MLRPWQLAASQARANSRAGPLPTSALSAPCHHHTCHHHTCRHHTCHRHKRIAPPMTKLIDYYLTLISPWAYIDTRRFAEIAQSHDPTMRVTQLYFAEIFPSPGELPRATRAPACPAPPL